MGKTIVTIVFMFITLTLLQVTVFNHICLFNLAVPFVFIYFIVRLPITMSINWILTLAFILGLIVDIFSDTHGMHALACTITAMSRRRILQLYFPREDDLTDPQPSIKTLGFGIYVKYLFTLVLFYCFLIFLIESFTLFNPLLLIGRIVFSTILTFAFILGIDSIIRKRREKRL